jgi:hypothetical protein
LSKLHVELSVVVDCRNATAMGLEPEDLMHDPSPAYPGVYPIPQALAEAALDRGAQRILTPSATLLGDTLIVLPDNFDSSCVLELKESKPMRPYVGSPS